jgi:hypothetical protein
MVYIPGIGKKLLGKSKNKHKKRAFRGFGIAI